ANAEWWREKILANRRRDEDTDRTLADAGWHVIRVWEHEPPTDAADRIQKAVAASPLPRSRTATDSRNSTQGTYAP
ncbi:MAG: hypothetical protein ACRD1H_10245, partial [Vicinamibacterales bacterium]